MNEAVTTIEYITIGDSTYESKSIQTLPDGIQFTLDNFNLKELDTLKDQTSITVKGSENSTPYGIYENVKFSSITIDELGTATIYYVYQNDIFVQLESMNKRLSVLEKNQESILSSSN